MTHLICNEPSASKKALAAEKWGTQVVGEDWLRCQLMNAAAGEGDSPAVQPEGALLDGQSVTVSGSSGTEYKLLNRGGAYSCSCPSWRNQSAPINLRSCKHLVELLGQAFESKRVGSSASSAKSTAAKGKAPGVLLAQKFEASKHKVEGWWMSEKLDGVRGGCCVCVTVCARWLLCHCVVVQRSGREEIWCPGQAIASTLPNGEQSSQCPGTPWTSV